MKSKQVVLTRFGGVEHFNIVTKDILQPCEGRVQIKILNTGIAFADVLMRQGKYPKMPNLPFTPGYDIVGEVIKVGSGVDESWIGKRVAALIQWGGYAQYTNLPVDDLVEVPEYLAPEKIICLTLNYATAYQLIHRVGQLATGNTVLVHGAAGGVGSALLQLAKLKGMKVYGTASKHKHELVRKENAVPIDYKTQDFEQFIREKEPGGIDAFFDFRGGESFNRSFRLLKKGGIALIYGLNDAGNNFDFIKCFTKFFFKRLLSGRQVTFYSIMHRYNAHKQHYKTDLKQLIQWLEEGKIEPHIAKIIGLEEIPATHRDFEAHKFTGKIVVAPQK